MRSPSILIASLVLAATTLTPAQAETKKELIDKLLKVQQPQVENLGNVMLQQTLGPMMQQVGMALQTRVAPDKREALGKAIGDEIRAFTKEVEPVLRASALKNVNATLAPKLEASFSEDELKQLIQFLESPVIKRYSALAPELHSALAKKVSEDNRPMVETKIRALDAKISGLLGLPAAPAPAASAKPASKPASKP